jgi:hypothetical protein
MILRLGCVVAGFWLGLAAAVAQTGGQTNHQIKGDQANEQRLARFDYVAPVLEGQDAVRKIELTYEVLQRLQRRDRRDIQVFNAAGQAVPSRVFKPFGQPSTQTQRRALSYFPVTRQIEDGKTRYSFEFSNNDDITSINLSPPDTASAQVSDYIVHLDREHTRSLGSLAGLQFDWETTDQNLLLPLRVEGSDDLQSWEVLNDDAVLSDLKHDGVALIRNSIDLSSYNGDYLRITWPALEAQFVLTGITGKFVSPKPRAPWRQTTVTCEKQDSPNECWLNVGALPVETLQLHYFDELPQSDYFLQGTLFSRNAADRSWTRRGSFQQYRLTFDGRTISEPASAFPGNLDPLWKVVYDQATLEPYPERAEISWRPVYLAFVAQGEGPFKIAFGSETTAGDSGRSVTAVLKRSKKNLADLEAVAIGPVAQNTVELDFWTRDQLETYALWAVLLFGVGVMLWIAMGLFRRMGAEDT